MSDDHIPIGAVVALTWGEPPEGAMAIVQWWADDGAIVSLVNDHTQLEGYVWFARDGLVSIAQVPDADASVRHLRIVGIRREADQVEHGSLTALLAAAQASGVLLFFQDAGDGSDAGSVGRVLRHDGETVVFSDVDTDGRDTADELERALEDILRVAWDDDYLRALTVLNALD